MRALRGGACRARRRAAEHGAGARAGRRRAPGGALVVLLPGMVRARHAGDVRRSRARRPRAPGPLRRRVEPCAELRAVQHAKGQPARGRRMAKLRDLTGMRFGMLVVRCLSSRATGGAIRWHCDCDCGNSRAIRSRALLRQSRPARSCGCRSRASQFGLIHPASRRRYANGNTVASKSARLWRRLMGWFRRHKIKPPDEWRDVDGLIASIGPAPARSAVLCRRDVGAGWSPGNAEWVAPAEAARRTSAFRQRRHRIAALGRDLSVREWAAELGVSASGLRGMLKRASSSPSAVIERLWERMHNAAPAAPAPALSEWARLTGPERIMLRMGKGASHP